ncbi:MAG: adenylate/guanylate cyclase domain-containing protein [Thiolinea sp.]
MNKKRHKHPKHIQVAINSSLIVRILSFSPLLIGVLLFPEPNPYAIFLSIVMIALWTPLSFYLSMVSDKPIKTEINNLQIEGFLIGLVIPLLDFNPVFIFVVVVITGMGGIAYGGFLLCLKRYLVLALGIGICVLFVGFNYKYEALLSTITIMGLSVLFSVFTISYGSFTGAKQAVYARKELKEKKLQLEQLTAKLAKYLSPQVYNSIFLGEKEVKIETYRKKITIFFSDIKGFTETTDSMESEALASLLNNYLNEMAEIALRHGGTIDKFIGDAILIFFGDPESRGDVKDAEACVLMAIEMRERMKYLRKKWEGEGVTKPLHIRCGINTGFCTVGNFGSENRLDYTIVGGQVNLTSRLESHAEPDQILISQTTYALVKDGIRCEKKDEIKVRGINNPIQTFQVLGVQNSLTDNREKINQRVNKFLELVKNENLSSSDKDYIIEKILKRL